MAEPDGKSDPIEDGEHAEERRAQGSVVAGLNALSANVSETDREGLGYAGREESMQVLAAAIDAGTLRIPRLLVLDSLVRLASRRPEEIRRDDPALEALVQALVNQPGVPLADQEAAVATVHNALGAVAAPGLFGTDRPWPTFARRARYALRLTEAEVHKPLCNDTEVVVKGPYEATGVWSEFHTDVAPVELTDWCDPTRWHECSAYFAPMVPWDEPGAVDATLTNGWRRDLLETVELAPAKTLYTPLRFTYTVDAGADPRWVHLDYVLLRATDDIVVDEGSLDARRVTLGPHAGRTRVTAKKAIRFADPLRNTWPTLACDTFWTDLVIDASVGCPDGGAVALGAGGTGMADTRAERLTDAIDDAAKAAQESIDAYTGLAKQAASQLTGDAPADTAAWTQLTTKAWSQAAGDAARAWRIYTDMLRILAEPNEPAN